ncbi:MAG: VCBS repeat-containing protein, partial [Spirochaetes bacterium]|nr:VCBS repeat-containing protein [Spirochaetota bacterium]
MREKAVENYKLKRNHILHLFIFFSFTLFITPLKGGTFTNDQEPMGVDLGVWVSSIALGDYDNDGDLDIALTGDDGANNRFIIYHNDSGTFNLDQEPMSANQGVNSSSIVFGDYDNDGDLDIALTGDGGGPRFIIFRNDSGTFTNVQEPMGVNLGVGSYSSIAFGDIDNDSDLDIALTGADGGNRRFIIFRNDSGTFTNIQEPMGVDQGVEMSFIAFGDYDNDGDLDIALTGTDGPNYRFIIFRNEAGIFTNAQEPMGADQGVWYPSIAFGDYDNDNDLDIVLTGREINDRFIIFRNDAGTFTNIQEPMGSDQGVWESSIAFGDIDNDGDLDLALTGRDNIGPNRRFIIFRNDGGTFTNIQEPIGINQGVNDGSIAFGDIDNDGDLDIALTGRDGVNNRFIIFTNNENTPNNEPSVPTGMNAINSGGYYRFQWDQSSDDHTPSNVLRYKIAIGTNSGVYDISSSNINYPPGQANIGNVPQGWMGATCFYQSKIPVTETAFWKVSAIDTAFQATWCLEQTSFLQAQEISAAQNVYSIDSIVLSPNPFRPEKNNIQHITFHNLPSHFQINIYSIAGGEIINI